MGTPINMETIEAGDRVRINAVGTVNHVHSNGRLDIKWEGTKSVNSVDVELLTLEDEEE